MPGKKMEGDEDQRRKKAREARNKDKLPSEEGATLGSSKQRQHLPGDADHEEKIETIREGKHKVIRENTPEVRPRSRDGEKD